MYQPTPIAIVGPTAVGKSAVTDAVAIRLGGELVSADSMQVYRGMDIGTAKTRESERKVPLHCVDLVEPGEPYSAALYQREARAAIEDIASRGLVPVLVGGTGLYVRAALDEFDFPAGDVTSDARQILERRAADEGAEVLHAELTALDPAAAELIHPHNVRRTIRALEMLAGGRSYSEQAAGFVDRSSHYPGTRFIGLTMQREALYARINERVDAMVQAGLLEEVEQLVSAGYRESLTSMQAIGYKELLPVLDGTVPLAEAVESIKRSSRRYAKRQISWFGADDRIRWLDVTNMSLSDEQAAVLDLLESSE